MLSWSALLGHFIENLSHKKKSLTENEVRSSVSVKMRRIWNLNDKRLPCIPEQWCWKFETRPQGSAPRLWVVKLEVWNPSVKQRRNFPRKIPRKLYYDGLRTKVWCGEWRKEATEKQLSLATFTSWFVLSFFLSLEESYETLWSLRQNDKCLYFKHSGTHGFGSNISSETK